MSSILKEGDLSGNFGFVQRLGGRMRIAKRFTFLRVGIKNQQKDNSGQSPTPKIHIKLTKKQKKFLPYKKLI